MKPFLVTCVVAVLLATIVSDGQECAPRSELATARAPSTASRSEGTRMLGRLPVTFVPNLGQWDHDARYVTRVGAMTVFLEERGWSFTLVERTSQGKKESREPRHDDAPARGVAVRMTFVGARQPELVAEQVLPGKHNYFLGNDATKWRSDVPLYGSVRYRGMHDGVDVRAREHDGHFEYDLLLAPDADLAPVEVVVDGIEGMHIATGGDLVMETALGPVRMPVPVSWEEGPNGETTPIACHYVLRGASRFGFAAPTRQPGWAMVVDPGLVWSTYLGGSDGEGASDLALDAQGAVTVVGDTASPNFPITAGAFDATLNGSSDVFVTKLAPSGASLVYSTFLGGSNWEGSAGIALDGQGAATIGGSTGSSNFPTTPGAFDATFGGGYDGFVVRLAPSGSLLVYSTYLGGTLDDYLFDIAIDLQGAATVAGYTLSGNFPTTTGALDTTPNGYADGFVTRLSPTGASLIYSTLLGGVDFDAVNALAVDSQGATTMTGWTMSTNFPTTPGAFDATLNTIYASDAFVARLSATGTSLLYSTLLGGTGNDYGNAIALDGQGAATIAGETVASDFPTTLGAFNTTYNPGVGLITTDAFVARISPTGSSLVWSTYLGGPDSDRADDLALDARGATVVVGYAGPSGFPTTIGAFDTTSNGGDDAFVLRLSPTGSDLEYATLFGASNNDLATAVVLDAQGAATFVGWTRSNALPTTPGAFDTVYNGGFNDAFVSRLDMLPTGVSAFGASSPGCTGPLAISVTSSPRVGNTQFAFTCGNAAPSTVGLIAFASSRLTTSLPALGVDVWLDPTTLLVSATVTSNAIGACDAPLPIANNPALAGMGLFTQFLWLGPSAPAPCPVSGFSASNALDFTIQP